MVCLKQFLNFLPSKIKDILEDKKEETKFIGQTV